MVPWFLRQDVLEKFRGYRMPTGTTKLQVLPVWSVISVRAFSYSSPGWPVLKLRGDTEKGMKWNRWKVWMGCRATRLICDAGRVEGLAAGEIVMCGVRAAVDESHDGAAFRTDNADASGPSSRLLVGAHEGEQ